VSSSTVYGLWPGQEKRIQLRVYKNAWGMAPVVWNALAQHYLKAEPHGWSQHMDHLWDLADKTSLPRCDRAVLRMTFDTRYILATDVERAINDIALFLHAHKHLIDDKAANHWPTYAWDLAGQWQDAPKAFGVHHTSVSENPWEGPYDETLDKHLPFDWSIAASVYEGL